MAFENTIKAIKTYNQSTDGTIIKVDHLRYVIQNLIQELNNEVSSLPAGGTTGQVLAKATDADGAVEWIDPQFLPLEGGTMQGNIEMDGYNVQDIVLLTGDSADLNLSVGTYSSTNGAGLTYVADYSANYTNRSLVDKEYVDQAIATAIAAIP